MPIWPKQCEHDRQLEGEAESQDKHHHEIKIGFDIRHQLNGRLARIAR